MCKYKLSLTKAETFYIVALLNSNNCKLADNKYLKFGHIIFILVQL